MSTALRVALLAALAAGPALAQAPAMPGMSHGTMPGMARGPSMPANPPANQAANQAANQTEMMQKMEAMNRATTAAPMTGNPDQDFVGMMTPHHQGAIDMARIYLRDGRDPAIRRMAQKIITDQEREIREFEAWQAKHPAPAG